MGGSQSVRKVGFDNGEPIGVIRVSENVAQRLKNINNDGKQNGPNTGQTLQTDLNTKNPVTYQQTGTVYMPQSYVTSSMIREEVEKELEKNDRFWERRIKTLQDNQNRIGHALEMEFNKACKEVETKFPSLAPKERAEPCQDYKSMVVDCFKNNANHTLNCSKVVNEFQSCITSSRSIQLKENRSP